jgi:hypothetical protein
MLDLDPIKQRAAAATPGPWTVDKDPDIEETLAIAHPETHAKDRMMRFYSDFVAVGLGDVQKGETADADFIAQARADVPALVAEVESLRERLKAITTGWPDPDDDEAWIQADEEGDIIEGLRYCLRRASDE